MWSVVMPLEKTYRAEAFGMVIDKFGVNWIVNCDQTPTLTTLFATVVCAGASSVTYRHFWVVALLR